MNIDPADDALAVQPVKAAARPALLTRRFQLLGGLVAGVILPGLYRWNFDLVQLQLDSLQNALAGAVVAMVAGYYFHQRFDHLPGVRSGSSILASFCVSFALVMTFFLLMRLDYSRYVFASSFVISIIWFAGIHLLTARDNIPKLAIVPGGNASSLLGVGGACWLPLVKPVFDAGQVNGIVADLRHDHEPRWERFLADCALAGIAVYHTKQLTESLTGRVQIEHLSENTFGSLLPDMIYLRVKQVIDFIFAVLALPFFALVVAVVAPLTTCFSRHPVFFTQDRVGYGGHIFKVYKFRTMRTVDTALKDAAITRDGDERITALGRVLRKYRIDELPQLINILRGEMSWIGPRPEALALSRGYERELPFYRYRHVVRPGISGWAQANQGHVAATHQVMEKLHYDFFYIKNISPWLDLLIVLKTIRTVVTGFGAK